MGKALFYCFKCSCLLKEDDLDKGKAFRIGDRVACQACAKTIPGAVPEEPQPARPRSSSQRIPVPPHTQSRSFPVAKPKRSPLPFVLGGAGLLLFAVIVAVMSGGSSPTPTAAPKTVEAAVDPREEAARQALEKARKVEPSTARASALDDVVWKHSDTQAARTAAGERDRLRVETDEKTRGALRELDARLAPLLAREAFGEALQVAPGRGPDIQRQAARLYEDQRAKAETPEALRALAARVKTWGLPDYVARVEKELPVELSPEAKGWLERWEAAILRASKGDYPGALTELKAAAAAVKEPAVQAEAKRDVDDLTALTALRPKLKGAHVKLLPGRFLSVSIWLPDGTPKRFDGILEYADEHRARVRTGSGLMNVEWDDLTMGDKAAFYAERSGIKPKEEPRQLALLCLIEGAPVSARARIGKSADTVTAKWWAFGESGMGKPRPPPPDEAEARVLLFEADREFASFEKFPGAVEKYRALRDRLGATPAVKSAIDRIKRRADAGKDWIFTPADLRGDGAVRRDAEQRWILSKDAPGAVELSYAALPGATYKAWGLLGGCCMESLSPRVEGTGLADQPLILQPKLPKTHAEHAAKVPLRWEWISLPVPRDSTPGARSLRIKAAKGGFGVAAAVVSSTRTGPPGVDDLKDVKRDVPDVFLGDGLMAHWTFDEGSGEEAKDVSWKLNNALLKGAAWLPEGLIGGAVRVDVGGFVEVPNTKTLENVQEASYTIAAWYLPAELPASGTRHGIVNKTGVHLGMSYDASGQYFADHWTEGNKRQSVSSVKTYPPGVWRHVVQNYNRPAGTLELFVDGEWRAYKDVPRDAKAVDYKTQPFRMGVANPGAPEHAWPSKGSIDDVRIYARALGIDEIRALYRLGR